MGGREGTSEELVEHYSSDTTSIYPAAQMVLQVIPQNECPFQQQLAVPS